MEWEMEVPQEKDGMTQKFALKSSLRKGMLRTLRGMPDDLVEQQSQAVTQLLFDSPFFQRAKTVACYLSMAHGELRTGGIVSELLRQGKSLYIPFIPPQPKPCTGPQTTSAPPPPPLLESDMRMLRLYSPDDLARCPLDKWGILDPGEYRRDQTEGEQLRRENALDPSAPDIDLILLPGVAFDKHCNRLGRGKAYYDRYLTAYTASRRPPLLVALALTPQLLPSGQEVPTTDTDFQLDGVLSPSEIVWQEEQKVERS